ncbi:type II toxin-antitoxin system prevent-host-death family antitoxin [Microbacterium aerolatum]|uniref:type II toxin-antitoxin system Phd/YefM family antitoxin n=1 Tax=Microbacterium aerolatum TaxID=153731 RepID=UPI0038500301
MRELRDGLSRYLTAVRDGEEITVTDHGKPVAKLVPINQDSPLERLIAEGVVTPAANRGGSSELDPRIKLRSGMTVSDLISEQRR